ncbi:MAG: DUF4340 domain-containing protein [Phycisphaerales bacterium]
MSWRVTLALCGLALAALAVSVLVASRAPNVAPTALRPLLDERHWKPDRVDAITIARPGHPTLRLVREGDGWIEREPSGLAVDPFLVNAALEAAGALRVSRAVAPEQPEVGGSGGRAGLSGSTSLAALGLDPPEAVVTFSGAEGGTTLRLGRPGVAGRAFVQLVESGHGTAVPSTALPTAGVAVVGQELHDAILRRDPSQWRLRSLLDQAGAETQRLEFEGGGTRMRLVRRGPRWTMEAPVATRADQAAVASYLDAIARSECAGFLEDLADESETTLAKFGLATPVGRFTMAQDASRGSASEPAPQAVRTLFVGAPVAVGGSDRFGLLDGHPTLLRLDAAMLKALFPNPALLVDPTATGIAAADVRSIRLSGPAGSFTLARDLDRWTCVEDANATVPTKAVEELLRRLTMARAGSIVLQPLPRDRIVGRIELRGFDGASLAGIDIAIDGARANCALDAGDGVARLFPVAQGPDLTPAAYGATIARPVDSPPPSHP